MPRLLDRAISRLLDVLGLGRGLSAGPTVLTRRATCRLSAWRPCACSVHALPPVRVASKIIHDGPEGLCTLCGFGLMGKALGVGASQLHTACLRCR